MWLSIPSDTRVMITLNYEKLFYKCYWPLQDMCTHILIMSYIGMAIDVATWGTIIPKPIQSRKWQRPIGSKANLCTYLTWLRSTWSCCPRTHTPSQPHSQEWQQSKQQRQKDSGPEDLPTEPLTQRLCQKIITNNINLVHYNTSVYELSSM